jgi:TolB-like protein/predicted Zn-dependent protease
MNGLSLKGFVRELRRRHTFRTVGLYIVGAWLVTQAADVFFPAWGLPDAAINVLLATAILGFPLVLVFGWFYDITADGVVRTREAGTDDNQTPLALRRKDYVLLGAIGLIAAFIVYNGVQDIVTAPQDSAVVRIPETQLPEKLEHSIAVLPFANTSNDPDNEAFCDGISEEILHKLSSYTELNVIGRTSSFSFKGSNYRIPRIAGLLGVRYLLQGSVRRDGENLRILASLVNEKGEQQWSDSFDRKLESVFAIQAEIADVVAAIVVPQIVPGRASSYEPDLAAYQQYLIGRELLRKRDSGAADVLAKATELDPSFAAAYAELAIAVLIGVPNVERGRQAFETALSLQPGLPRALAAKGLLLLQQDSPDYAASEQVLREVLAKNPDDVDAMNWLSNTLSAQGKDIETLRVMERAVRIDPLHGVLAANLATAYANRGDFDRAEKMLLRQLELPEPGRAAFIELRFLYLHTGQLVEMNAIAKRQALKGLHVYYGLALNYAVLGLWDAAQRWANLTQADFPNFFWAPIYPSLVPIWQGRYVEATENYPSTGELFDRDSRLVAYQYGELQAQAGDFDGALATLEPWLQQTDINARGTTGEMPSHALAWAYRETGRGEEAEKILGAIERHFASYEAQNLLHSSDDLFNYAQNALLLGNHDTAIDRLERAVDAGWREYLIRRHDPRWAPLQNHPRYVSLMQRVMADVERQRAKVERIDAEDDFMKRFEAARRLRR